MRILLIEDDVLDVQQFRRMFANEHEITTVATASKAIEAIKSKWDLVVCDYRIPGAVDRHLIRAIESFGFADRLIVLTHHSGLPDTIEKTPAGYQRIRDRIASMGKSTLSS